MNTTTTHRSSTRTRTVAVFVDGPFPSVDREGEEVPEWTVYAGDDEAEPTGTVYRCSSWAGARSLGARMARDRRLELVDESGPA
jgi:hypothetical protein